MAIEYHASPPFTKQSGDVFEYFCTRIEYNQNRYIMPWGYADTMLETHLRSTFSILQLYLIVL